MKTPVRKVTVDYAEIFRETGLRRGVICRSRLVGWCVQNLYGLPGPNIVAINPPPMEEGEALLRIEGNEWVFYADTNQGKKSDH